MIKLKLKLSDERLTLGDLYPEPYLLNDEIRGFFVNGYFICNNDKPIPQKGIIRKELFVNNLDKNLIKRLDKDNVEYEIETSLLECFYEIDLNK